MVERSAAVQTIHTLRFVCSNCSAGGGNDRLTAWATVALAAITTLLALATFRAVRQGKLATQAAVDEAKATETLVRRGALPLVLPVKVSTSVSSSAGAIDAKVLVRIHNVGLGPAVNLGLDLIWPDGVSRSANFLDARRAAIPAGHAENIGIGFAEEIPQGFTVQLSFSDSLRAHYRSSCVANGPHIFDVAMWSVDKDGNELERIVG